MKSAFLMLAALVASLVCLCWGGSTGESIPSANPPDSDSEFAGSMTSPQDSATTSTYQDLCPTGDGKLDPGRTSPRKPLEDQIDDLLAILRDIQSFIMPAFPGAGRIVIIISIFSLLQERVGAACIMLEALPPRSATESIYQPITPSPPHVWEEFELALQNGSDMRIMKTLFDVVCYTPTFLYLHFRFWLRSHLLTIAMDPWVAFKAFSFGLVNLPVSLPAPTI
ncbi:hypothetical protein FMUND_2892 [Fusarium mundagurra]|uniref:Uncharacterized protein n=1 Tax=Fusarium mundagurra TaxID=1567541 RepID=A0A8H5Z3X9_9HYPO|nr:hypothetical protein FMUND_2892 [Fusarium mundagurra]